MAASGDALAWRTSKITTMDMDSPSDTPSSLDRTETIHRPAIGTIGVRGDEDKESRVMTRDRRRPRRRRGAAATATTAATALCVLSSWATRTSAFQQPLQTRVVGATSTSNSGPCLSVRQLQLCRPVGGVSEIIFKSRLGGSASASAIRMATPSSSSSSTDRQNGPEVPDQQLLDESSASLQGAEILNDRISNGFKFNPSDSESDETEKTKVKATNLDNNQHKHKHDLEQEQQQQQQEQQQQEQQHPQKSLPPLLQKVVDKVGKIDESRIISTPEYLNGDVPKLFSNLLYSTIERPNVFGNGTETVLTVTAQNSEVDTNFLSSSALLCGTALGCGLLTLPTAINPVTGGAGYLPTIIASLVAWGYMTISALLTSELLINRCGETGRVRNVGLLELYTSYLGEAGGKLAGVGFLIVSYVVMGVYLSEGGDQLSRLLEMNSNGIGNGIMFNGIGIADSSMYAPHTMSNILQNHSLLARALFATIMGTFLSAASKLNNVQKAMTHFFVPVTLLAFVVAISIGLPTTNFAALTALENQHPEVVLNAFPLLFMGWTYHGVVPRVVYDLEGDKDKITKAIVGGSTAALVIYLAWNAMVVGNVLGGDGIGAGVDGSTGGTVVGNAAAAASSVVGSLEQSSAVVLGDMLGMEGDKGSSALAAATSLNTLNLEPVLLQSSVALVSELAVVTSLIGVVLGFVNEFNDAVFGSTSSVRSKSYGPKDQNDKWKVALLTLLPPAIISITLGYYSENYDINNYQIIDYTGIFGSSILFLILPALMAWQNRYGEEDSPRPLTVRPMVPLGKIALGSLYKAAGTLIVEQGLEKLGVFEFVKEHFLKF